MAYVVVIYRARERRRLRWGCGFRSQAQFDRRQVEFARREIPTAACFGKRFTREYFSMLLVAHELGVRRRRSVEDDLQMPHEHLKKALVRAVRIAERAQIPAIRRDEFEDIFDRAPVQQPPLRSRPRLDASATAGLGFAPAIV
jgi:hypothetical protein